MKRCHHGADDENEPKRFRMSDIPQDDIARPMRTSGFLASALFREDRDDSDSSTMMDRNHWDKESPSHIAPTKRHNATEFFREQRRLVRERAHRMPVDATEASW
jgi:hypothetical protein